jgi:hypothetical protein
VTGTFHEEFASLGRENRGFKMEENYLGLSWYNGLNSFRLCYSRLMKGLASLKLEKVVALSEILQQFGSSKIEFAQ